MNMKEIYKLGFARRGALMNCWNREEFPSGLRVEELRLSEMALDYVRARHVGKSADFGRTGRQRALLKAILKKAKDSSLPEVMELLKGVRRVLKEGHASSDLCWEQLTGLGLTALDLAQSEGEEWFVTGSVPAQGQYLDEKRDGMAVLVPKDWETLQEELHRMLYG